MTSLIFMIAIMDILSEGARKDRSVGIELAEGARKDRSVGIELAEDARKYD